MTPPPEAAATAPERVGRGGSDGPGRGRGWMAVALVTAVVAISWAPELFAALGDNHEGRIFARHALQMQNLFDLGWSGSDWSTSMAPMGESYSHHPPGFKPIYALAWLMPGRPEFWLRLVPYLLGLGFLPAAAGLLRRLRVGWGPIAVALAAAAATPLFWVYGRLWPALGLVALLAWAVADLREREQVTTGRLVAVTALAVFAVLANWFAMATAALLGLWLLAGRGVDRVTVTLGAAMTVAAAATFGWVLAAPDRISEADQLAFRTSGGGFTTAEFLARMGRWLDELVPLWAQVVGAVGAAWGLVDRRVRVVTAGGIVLAVGWVGLFPNGSFIHDYWIMPVLLAAVPGLAALVDRAVGRLPPGPGTVALGALGVAGAVAFGAMLAGPAPDEYLRGPHAAGALVRDTAPAAGQQVAWHTRFIAGPRWYAWYWDLPTARVDDDSLAEVPPEDLVLVTLDRLPRWVADGAALESSAVARRGGYVLVRGADLRAAADG